MSTNTPEFTEAVRRPGKRLGDPEQVWQVAPAPFPSSEGHRIVWVHSSAKQHRDETARHERIQRTLAALAELNERLAGPRARITTRVGVDDAATEIVDTGSAEQYVTFTITETTEETFRQEKRGRPGNDTRYRKLSKTRFQVTAHVDTDQVRHTAASDGCFPLITNHHDLTNTAVLIAYRYQPNLEKRHHQLKSVHDAAPVTLNSPHRIEALFACQFIALLCCRLIERELRNAITRQQITDLPPYPEHRSCTAPTTARVFDHLTPIQRHHLTRDRHTVQTFEPQLTPLQTQLLDLLAVPTSAYTSQP
jgi:transposase